MGLYHEILEQPHILGGLLKSRPRVEQVCGGLARRSFDFALVAARGSSDHAALYAKYLLGMVNRLPVALAAPSLFTFYDSPPDLRRALVIGISQSGASQDIVSVLQAARKQGAPTLAITNHPQSPLGETAEWVLDIQAGEERAIAATKTYTATLLMVAMLAAGLTPDAARFAELDRLPELVTRMLEEDLRVQRMVERYRYMTQCIVLGRGFNYTTAYEWSLKLKELAYVAAEPYSSADFQHGPIALVENGFPVLAAVPSGAVSGEMVALVRRLVEERQAELVAISDVQGALELARSPIPLPAGIPEWISPIVCVIPAQLFCYHITRAKGLDPEHPRGLAKITLTR
jgi:glucosamine--fructose-6-phosphate aminotransferase (isomerizing)